MLLLAIELCEEGEHACSFTGGERGREHECEYEHEHIRCEDTGGTPRILKIH